MPAQGYDIITIGGGIAASALAKAMAEQGAKVLVLEREVKFKDRVRGEALVCWGGGEARELGIYELLRKSCGHDVPFVQTGMGLRDSQRTRTGPRLQAATLSNGACTSAPATPWKGGCVRFSWILRRRLLHCEPRPCR